MTLRSGAAADDLTARERILAAAEKLFAERGFDRTSTARIATEAGVPHGLIFYHFKTKMDLLLAVIRDDRVTALDDLLPALDPGTDLREAVSRLWCRLSSVLGEPSTARKIMIQELDSHPEIRQRALELHDRIVASVSAYLAQASQAGSASPGHRAQPGPEHVAAARLLTITAGMAPLLGVPSLSLVPPDALAVLISDGLGGQPPEKQ
jgi:AcrR family transcriptional regulator